MLVQNCIANFQVAFKPNEENSVQNSHNSIADKKANSGQPTESVLSWKVDLQCMQWHPPQLDWMALA